MVNMAEEIHDLRKQQEYRFKELRQTNNTVALILKEDFGIDYTNFNTDKL